jgi:lysophospholipase L1-like esterase
MIGTNDTKKPIPTRVYRDNIRQIIMSARSQGMTPIVGTLPALKFSPYYQNNRDYIEVYNTELKCMAADLGFVLCDMSGLDEFLIDGVHFDNEGYTEIAKRFAAAILSLA